MSLDARRNGMPVPQVPAHPKNEGLPRTSADGQSRTDGAGLRLRVGSDVTNQIVWYDANDVARAWIYVNTSNQLIISGDAASTISAAIALTATTLNVIAFRTQKKDKTLANGANNDVDFGAPANCNNLIIGPTGAFNITGIANGADGQIIFLANTTSQVMTLRDNNAGSAAGNKILTGTGADLVTNHAILLYDITNTVWRVY